MCPAQEASTRLDLRDSIATLDRVSGEILCIYFIAIEEGRACAGHGSLVYWSSQSPQWCLSRLKRRLHNSPSVYT